MGDTGPSLASKWNHEHNEVGGSLSGLIMPMPPRPCTGTWAYEELCPPYEVFSHLLPEARGPQTFALSVATSVYKRAARMFLGKGNERGVEEKRESEGKVGPSLSSPGTLLRLRVISASLGPGSMVISEQLPEPLGGHRRVSLRVSFIPLPNGQNKTVCCTVFLFALLTAPPHACSMAQ